MIQLRLRRYHDLAGAIFRTEAGWEVPAGYGPVDAEVRAVRTRAGMIDLSDRAKLELTGSERVPFLDGLVTVDIKVLTPGTSAYALLLNEKSRVLADLRVYVFPDCLALDVEAAQADAVLRIMEKSRISDDVAFRNLGPCGHLVVLGPASGDPVSDAIRVDLRGLPLDAFATVPLDKRHDAHVARLRASGEVGFSIWSRDASLGDLWEALSRRGVTPIGREAAEVLRIEAGVPRIGADMGEDTLALEAAPETAISFTKGCYVGQEVVARGTYIGQVRRKLVGLRVDGDVPPVRGDRISKGTREVGFVTSGAWSPTLGWVVALALLRFDEVTRQDLLLIDRGGWDLRARLYPLSFLRGSA